MQDSNDTRSDLEIALERIAIEADKRTGRLDLQMLDIETLPDELLQLTHLTELLLGITHYAFGEVQIPRAGACGLKSLKGVDSLTNLQHLSFPSTKIRDISPLKRLEKLQTLDFFETYVENLKPLENLTNLKSLNFHNTNVKDLSPLSNIKTIMSINCYGTNIKNIYPIENLTNLTTLKCFLTDVSDLSPLSNINSLEYIDCSYSNISDLSPLSNHGNLRTIDCSRTNINDLRPLSDLRHLQSLKFYKTSINDIGPLSRLSELKDIDCSETDISDMSPLLHLRRLQSLDCSKTQVYEISALVKLINLKSFTCNGCTLLKSATSVLRDFTGKLFLYDTQIPGVPSEVLSQTSEDDCRDRLIAHLADMVDDSASHKQCKLVVLGNGRVGKTQICRQLRGEDYDDKVPSTHGITVTTAPLTDSDVTLSLWDFGGQDIYHGTHGLFMRTRSIFLVAWTPAMETSTPQVEGDFVFRSYPLAYWLDYVKELSGTASPIIVVQARCDSALDETRLPTLVNDRLAPFSQTQVIQYSARTGRRRGTLDESLNDAFAFLQDQLGTDQIGGGRLKVLHRLEEMRQADEERKKEDRLNRTLSLDQFRQMCEDAGSISSPELFLNYLHLIGAVFYQDDLIDRIVLDQSWALNAIYTVFDRESCLKELRHLRGRFRRNLLGLLAWSKYDESEQELFLRMMLACGICFVHRPRDGDGETEYIAPDLLPEKDTLRLEFEVMWDNTARCESVTLSYPLLHDGLIRSIMSRLGQEAGMNGLYWKGGLCLYEHNSRSRAVIEQHMTGDWQGDIRIRTQGGQAAQLLASLLSVVEAQEARTGLSHTPIDTPDKKSGGKTAGKVDIPAPPPILDFVPPPRGQPNWYVSYAWGDTTPEGQEGESAVEEVCRKGRDAGIEIKRDKDEIRHGDCISKFMKNLAHGDRICVLLSDKYLKSPYCMFELHEIWRVRSQDPELFRQAVRVFLLPGVSISNLAERAQYAAHWHREHDVIEKLIAETTFKILGPEGLQEFEYIDQFRRHVNPILTLINDTLRPGTIAEFCEHAFAPDPPA